MESDDEIILEELDDDELVLQMHDDLYDGMKDEIVEGVNILLNRVRADERKKKFETTIFIGLISLSVIVSGIILSFR